MVIIYKIFVYKEYRIDEHGVGFSLESWEKNYRGWDDGGKKYILPPGYELTESKTGEKIIIHDGVACHIKVHSSGRPQLISTSESMPVLNFAN